MGMYKGAKMTGSCQVDLLDEYQVIRYFRDLLNLSDLLDKGLDYEMLKFIKQLKAVGYDDKHVSEFITLAGYGTRYEQLIPRLIPSNGDYGEFQRSKSRCKK